MFTTLSLHRLLLKALGDLGLTKPTTVQSEAIPIALDGCDLKVEAETGSGKTVAYLLPTLHRLLTKAPVDDGVRALILLPTRELAQQVFEQCAALTKHTNLTSCLVSGGVDFAAQEARLIESPSVVVATIGRFLEHVETGTVDLGALEVLVLDEADRMLDMGFANEVLSIAQVSRSERQTLLFSATLNNKWLPSVANKLLTAPETLAISGGGAVLDQVKESVVLADHDALKQEQLFWLLTHESYEKAIVFTNSREQAELVCSVLLQKKQRAAVLHGEIDSLRRKRVMDLLREGRVNVLVATDVAARGLDIVGVDLVINFDMPRRGDYYTHRVGRTGRAGRLGTAITLVSPLEWNLKVSVERYLKRKFPLRTIDGLKAVYTGPKKQKSSGQAFGKKTKKVTKKKPEKKIKRRLRDKKNIGKRRRPKTEVSK